MLAADVAGIDESAKAELSSADQHPADEATETQTREEDAAVLGSIDEQLGELHAAYARLQDGTYGICEACGQPIESDRLEVLPLARYCVEDQVLVEHSVG